jgi:TolB-like protein/Tfp pilus assembly protein PilF
MAHDVFISYSNKDKNVAEAVCLILENNGIRCWIAPRDITPGLPFAEAIIDGIENSRVFVLIYSSNSNNSAQVIKEVDRAVHNRLAIIPLRLEDVPMTKQLEYYISDVHWMDALTQPLENHIEKLCRIVKILLTMDSPGNENVESAFEKIQGNRSEPLRKTKRFIDKWGKALIFIGLTVITGLVILNATHRDTVTKPGMIQSLVILPFDNETGDQNLEYFVSGMHSSLIGDMGRLSNLRVISKTSSDKYRDANKSIPQIASELDVDAVVEAQVMCLGDSICLQVRVVSADRKEKQLWVGNYREDKRKILGLYNQVTKQIADEVKVTLSPDEEQVLSTATIVNKDAYDAYLKGEFYYEKFTRNDFDTAIKYFELAVEIDPNYAPAYQGIASVWGDRVQMGFVSPEVGTPKAKEAGRKARELDPTLTNPWGSMWEEWDWKKAEEEFKKGIAGNPNDVGFRMGYSHLLIIVGRTDEALEQIRLAMKIDPKNVFARTWYGFHLTFAHRYDEAIEAYKDALKLEPDHPLPTGGLASAYQLSGKYKEAFEENKLFCRDDPELVRALDNGFIEGGYRGAYLSYASLAEMRFENSYWSPNDIAWIYAYIGEKEKTLYWLEKAYEMHDPNLPYLLYPLLDFIRDDPRFQDLSRRMKLPYTSK